MATKYEAKIPVKFLIELDSNTKENQANAVVELVTAIESIQDHSYLFVEYIPFLKEVKHQ